MKKLNNKGSAMFLGFLGMVAVSVAFGEFGIHQGWFKRHQPTIDTRDVPAPIQNNLGGEA